MKVVHAFVLGACLSMAGCATVGLTPIGPVLTIDDRSTVDTSLPGVTNRAGVTPEGCLQWTVGLGTNPRDVVWCPFGRDD